MCYLFYDTCNLDLFEFLTQNDIVCFKCAYFLTSAWYNLVDWQAGCVID